MPTKVAMQRGVALSTEIIQDIINYLQNSVTSLGKSAYSIGVRSIVETRDNLLLLCIALLEALDYLQERLYLPLSVVKRAKLKLKQIVESSSSNTRKPRNAKSLGKKIAESDVWSESKADDVQGFTMWIISLVSWLNALIVSSTSRICAKLLIMISDIPGTKKAKSYLRRLHHILDSIASATSETYDPLNQSTLGYVNSLADRNLTAVVLSYREKEDVVPWCTNRRIQRMMHYRVSLRPFEATIRLSPDGNTNTELVSNNDTTSIQEKSTLISTPQSFPASPAARSRVLADFSDFADDVLYRVRDELRSECLVSRTGLPRAPFATFDQSQAHPDIFLSCGYHCAAKVGSGVYRSVRASLPITKGRYVYFEMSISRFCTIEANACSISNAPSSLAIGLSTKEMPLNTLVGTWKHSIGLYSSGHIITGSQWHKYVAVDISYGWGNTVGVLTYITDNKSIDSTSSEEDIQTARIQFVIDGKALHDGHHQIPTTLLTLPAEAQVFPTLTLYSADTQVLCRFCSADILSSIEQLDINPGTEVWCIDGSSLGSSSMDARVERK